MTITTHKTGLPDFMKPKRSSNYVEHYVPLSKRGEYTVEIHGRDLEWGTLRIVCNNHPDFSSSRQALTLAVKGGGFKWKPNDIDVYFWLEADDYHLPDDKLSELLKTVLI